MTPRDKQNAAWLAAQRQDFQTPAPPRQPDLPPARAPRTYMNTASLPPPGATSLPPPAPAAVGAGGDAMGNTPTAPAQPGGFSQALRGAAQNFPVVGPAVQTVNTVLRGDPMGTAASAAGATAVRSALVNGAAIAKSMAAAPLKTAGNVVMRVLRPVAAGYQYFNDTPEQRNLAGGGDGTVSTNPIRRFADEAGTAGAYATSGLSFGLVSPQAVGAGIRKVRGDPEVAPAAPTNEAGGGSAGSAPAPAPAVPEAPDVDPTADAYLAQARANAAGVVTDPDSPGFVGPSNQRIGLPRDISLIRPTNYIAPDSPQSQRLSAMGVREADQNRDQLREPDIARFIKEGSTTGGRAQNIGAYGGNTPIFASSSKLGGPIDTFVGSNPNFKPDDGSPRVDPVQAAYTKALERIGEPSGQLNLGNIPDNSSAINARFDEQAAVHRANFTSPAARGNLAKYLGQNEAARTAALEADAQNATRYRETSLNAQQAAAATRANQDMEVLRNYGNITEGRAGRAAARSNLEFSEAQALARTQASTAGAVQAAEIKAAEAAAKREGKDPSDARSAAVQKLMGQAVKLRANGDPEEEIRLNRQLTTISEGALKRLADEPPAQIQRQITAMLDVAQGQVEEGGQEWGASLQNAGLGSIAGAATNLIPKSGGLRKLAGLGIDKFITARTGGRYQGDLAQRVFGSGLAPAAVGAGVGAGITPAVPTSSPRLNPMHMSYDDAGNLVPTPAQPTVMEGFTHGFWDTFNPWATPMRGSQTPDLRLKPPTVEELAAWRDAQKLYPTTQAK